MANLIERLRERADVCVSETCPVFLNEAADELTRLTADNERLTHEIEAAIPHNQERRAEMNRLQADNERLSVRDRVFLEKITELEADLAMYQSREEGIAPEMERLKETVKYSGTELGKARERIEELEGGMRIANQELDKRHQRIQQLEHELNEARNGGLPT